MGINLVGNDLNVGSNIKIGNASGIVTATSFSGSGANLTSLPAANLTGTLPAISGANLTGLTSGITMIDSWSITSNFTQSAGHTEVTANWRRNYAGSTYWGVLGSAMTESSGVFSFPATGIYLVQFNFHGRSNGSAQSYIGARLFVSQNAGVGYGQMAFNYSQAYASQAHFNCSNSAILDVTNISNTKFRFNTEVQSSTIWFGETNAFWFDKFGIEYFTREIFDAFYPGYGASWPAYKGAIAMTYEQASPRGLLVEQYDQDVLHYRDAIRNHFVASLATLQTSSERRTQLLDNFYVYHSSAQQEGLKGDVKSFVLPRRQNKDAVDRSVSYTHLTLPTKRIV